MRSWFGNLFRAQINPARIVFRAWYVCQHNNVIVGVILWKAGIFEGVRKGARRAFLNKPHRRYDQASKHNFSQFNDLLISLCGHGPNF